MEVFRAAGYDIDAGSIHTAVSKYICQLHNILLQTVENSRKQVTKVVWKDFAWTDIGLFAEALHLSPNIRPAQWFSVSGNEYRTRFDMLIAYIST